MQQFLRTAMLATTAFVATTSIGFAAEEVVTIEGTNHPIPATITLPEGEGPFPFVVMFHGTGSNRHEAGNGYDLLAPKLAEAGIASARFDFAGNGDSTVDYVDYTLTGGMEDGLDVIAYMQGLDAIADDRLGVLGWSQGGTVAMLAAARNGGIESVATWNGALDLSGLVTEERYAEATKNGFSVLEFGWREPLNLSLEWMDEARNIKIAEELAAYDGALLAIIGEKDEVVPPAVADEIVAAAKGEPVRKEIIPGADHTFNIFSGDMTAFEATMAATVAWFTETL